MSVIECSNGHYYDDNKFDKCPICGEIGAFTEKKYIFLTDDNNGLSSQLTERYDENKSSEEELTVSLNIKNSQNSLTTGWLVCICGECKGKSFNIKTDRNFIGRDYDMDIIIPDNNVSRIKHCSIVYDGKSNEFYLLHGNSPCAVNGKFIETSAKLAEDDIISFGKSKYIFIPYCTEGRNWNE